MQNTTRKDKTRQNISTQCLNAKYDKKRQDKTKRLNTVLKCKIRQEKTRQDKTKQVLPFSLTIAIPFFSLSLSTFLCYVPQFDHFVWLDNGQSCPILLPKLIFQK